MKTILVLTDFSIRAEYASYYALKLAQKIKANLLLCNIFQVPTESLAAAATWPSGNYEAFEEDSINDLDELGQRMLRQLKKENGDEDFIPEIDHCTRTGSVSDCLNEIAGGNQVLMAVIGSHGANGLSSILMGNHTKEIIDNADYPVLVVPELVRFKGFKKIAFATDLATSDIDVLQCLSGFAKMVEAEILITHVTDENQAKKENCEVIMDFFDKAVTEIDYKKIGYRTINTRNVVTGLEWISQHKDIDMLVLVHRKRNFFQKIIDQSVTQKLTTHVNKPMLIFPQGRDRGKLPVF